MTQPQGLPEGIYFNLSNEQYHDDPALSHSGMTKILVSWPDYWVSSCLNPERRKFNQTDAMKFGERAGMLLLQPKLFHDRYNTHGKPYVNAKALYLSSVEWSQLTEGVDAIMEVPDAKRHFTDGYPEVSIFWKDVISGVMLRVRPDFLRTFGAIDYKRIAEVNNYAIGRAVKAQGLDIQCFLYLEGILAARRILGALNGHGLEAMAQREGVEEGWLEAFRDDVDLFFRFLFQRSTPPYIWEWRKLEDEVLDEGRNATLTAIDRYKKGLELYGVKKPPMGQNKIKTISQFHVPRRDYDYEQY